MITIRSMEEKDLDFAAARTASEGWFGESILETAGVYTFNPDGCFIAELQGEPMGMCCGIAYGKFGFLGELIVCQEARGKGIGRRLMDQTLHFLRSSGARSVYLDGVLPAISLYERAGFVKQFRSLRFRGRVVGKRHLQVMHMQSEDIDDVCTLDRKAFGADRSFFLKRRWNFYPALCKVVRVNGSIAGYIMGHVGHKEISVGPWVAGNELEKPLDLLEDLAAEVPLMPFALGCLEVNQAAVQLMRSLGLHERATSPWRMVFGENLKPGDISMQYAIGSPAKG